MTPNPSRFPRAMLAGSTAPDADGFIDAVKGRSLASAMLAFFLFDDDLE
jgi:hypothetical protein